MYNISQIHIHHSSDAVIIDIPLRWNPRVSNSFSASSGSWLGAVVSKFRWSWTSSIRSSTTSSLSLFFIVSISSSISGWFVLKTVWINWIVDTFHLFRRGRLIFIFAIFPFSQIFTSWGWTANRWSLWTFWSCEIRVFTFRLWFRLIIFSSNSLISLIGSFAWNDWFTSSYFSSSISFFVWFVLFRGNFASVRFS